jgi:excisionase family DNA binding protein
VSKLLTAQEVADMLSVHIETIRKWTREGRIKGRKLGKGSKCTVRYKKDDIDKWIDESTFPVGAEKAVDTE